MYFDSIAGALTMDGHGAFVWSAYLITTVAIALILFLPRRRERQFLKQLAGDLRRQQAHAESSVGDRN
ncbi:MAG: heme exporter protein CcmD [Halioglobus sp.]